MQKVIRPSLSEQDILIKNNLRVLKKLSHFATNASEDLIISRFLHPSAKTENLIRRIFSAITVTYQFQKTSELFKTASHIIFLWHDALVDCSYQAGVRTFCCTWRILQTAVITSAHWFTLRHAFHPIRKAAIRTSVSLRSALNRKNAGRHKNRH